jgi:hypothetical protein
MSTLIITRVSFDDAESEQEYYQAMAAVLPNGKILVPSDSVNDAVAKTLQRHVEMVRKGISDKTGRPATGDQLLAGIASRWNSMAVASTIFGDDEIDEAKKYVKISRMKNA